MSNARNQERNNLRNDLMSFSACVRKLDKIVPYVNRYAIDRMQNNKHTNASFMDIIDTDDPNGIYGFLNYLRTNVNVFGGILRSKKRFSEDVMFNLLTQVVALPPKDFKQKIRKTDKDGNTVTKDGKVVWVETQAKGYLTLVAEWEKLQTAKAAAKAQKAKKSKAKAK